MEQIVKQHPTLDILVSSDGTIYKKDHRKTNPEYEVAKPFTRKGYLRLKIGTSIYSVHRLVLETFVGPCPEGKTCDHRNMVRDDNRIENLWWATASEQGFNSATHMRRDTRITVSQVYDRNEYARQWRALHRDQVREASRRYRNKHKAGA